MNAVSNLAQKYSQIEQVFMWRNINKGTEKFYEYSERYKPKQTLNPMNKVIDDVNPKST